jgi:glutamine synthetase
MNQPNTADAQETPRERAVLTTPAGRTDADTDRWDAARADLAARGVKYCLASYVDVHGIPKAKAVPLEHFGRMMKGSELFTGAAIDGLGQGPADDELSLWPDLDALRVLPWDPTVAWAPGGLHFRGEPYWMDSRNILKRQLDRLQAHGWTFNLGIETEFFLVLRDSAGVRPANAKDVLARAAYDVTGLLEAMPFVDEMVGYMNELGWDVHSFDHEDANSQFEFDFSYCDALGMADRLTLFRLMAKNVARRHGFEATFMPKPYGDRTGSGGHFNMSFADTATGENLFAADNDSRGAGMSELGYRFTAGILQHARAICAVSGPTVNSYKRLVKTGSMTGFTWAPVFVSYGRNNRTHMLRIPFGGGRLESRAVDMSCNPYLTAALMLAAGLDGIERELDPGYPIELNMYEQSEAQLQAMSVDVLPRTLLEAADAFRADPLSREAFGDELADSYADIKTGEWWDYHNTVSAWEHDRYLEFF